MFRWFISQIFMGFQSRAKLKYLASQFNTCGKECMCRHAGAQITDLDTLHLIFLASISTRGVLFNLPPDQRSQSLRRLIVLVTKD